MNDIVVGMGEALWDVLPEGKKIGGAPANFACFAVRPDELCSECGRR